MEQPHYHGHRKRLRTRFVKNGLAGFAEHEVIELLLTLAIPRAGVKQPAKAAMKGDLQDRPVDISHAQLDCAWKHGDAYWLYVVECAGGEDARIVRIQNPAGKAKTFTFDKGWLALAEVR